MPKKANGLLIVVLLCLPAVLFGQDKTIIVRHGSTPEGDIIRARADALLLLKQAELTGEKAYAQRLENLIRECDLVSKRLSTRNEMHKEALEDKFDRTFDIIRFNQQLTDIRSELEHKAVAQHTRIGDLTGEMNHLLEIMARQSLNATAIPAMKTELTSEQLDAIFLTDGSNTFSGKNGKTRLEAFKWPFVIQRKEFQRERSDFEVLCDQAVKEIEANSSPSPETVSDLLKQADAIDKKLDSLPLSDSQNVRAVETKWRKEAKAFLRELTRTLGNCSKLDSEKLAKYIFQGKTLGELIDHLNSKGLRFSHPSEQDANLYASVFFIMRYACGDSEGRPLGGTASDDTDRPDAKRDSVATGSKTAAAQEVFRFTLQLSAFGDVKVHIERTSQPPDDDFQGTPFMFSNWPHTKATKGQDGMFRLVHDFRDPDDLTALALAKSNLSLDTDAGLLVFTSGQREGSDTPGAMLDYGKKLRLPLNIQCDIVVHGAGGFAVKAGDARTVGIGWQVPVAVELPGGKATGNMTNLFGSRHGVFPVCVSVR